MRDADVDIIAVDGKSSRRRREGRNPLHLVSAWAARQRLVLGQQATEEKSNETIPLLLQHLDPKGALVTMAAMGLAGVRPDHPLRPVERMHKPPRLRRVP
jgi:hypothetical protein